MDSIGLLKNGCRFMFIVVYNTNWMGICYLFLLSYCIYIHLYAISFDLWEKEYWWNPLYFGLFIVFFFIWIVHSEFKCYINNNRVYFFWFHQFVDLISSEKYQQIILYFRFLYSLIWKKFIMIIINDYIIF